MSRRPPRVSIGLPVFNGGRFLAESIESLLAQTFEEFELIVSDNGSTDSTEEICREFVAKDGRIRYSRSESNLGAAWNYNTVFELATGEYFKWASHDDVHAPEFVAKCLSVLEQDPGVALCFTRTSFIDGAGAFVKDYQYDLEMGSSLVRERFWDAIRSNHIVYETFGLARRATMRKTPLIGNYQASDRVFLATLSMYGRFHEIPEILFFHREHEERSMRAFKSAGERQAWFDPIRGRRVVLPLWRQLFEAFREVVRGPLGPVDKATLVSDIAYLALWRRRQLGSDLTRATRQIVARARSGESRG